MRQRIRATRGLDNAIVMAVIDDDDLAVDIDNGAGWDWFVCFGIHLRQFLYGYTAILMQNIIIRNDFIAFTESSPSLPLRSWFGHPCSPVALAFQRPEGQNHPSCWMRS